MPNPIFYDPFALAAAQTLVWDNHSCVPLRPDDRSFLPALTAARDAGVDVVSLNVGFGHQGFASIAAMATSFADRIADNPDHCLQVKTVADAERARSSRRLGICFDVEGMDPLERDVDNVDRLYALGVRWMLAAYNISSDAGGGCLADDGGLTGFGRSVVARMNEVGMVCCASHCGHRTAHELIDFSSSPVIFSHSNPSAVWPHPRNVPDELIRACAARSGVIGINGFGPFLGPNDNRTETLADHIEHVLELVGDDHVGLALDYVYDTDELDTYIAADPVSFPPALYQGGAKMVEPTRIPAIAEHLSKRGHSIATIAKILGGNHHRIAREVWK